MTLENAKGLYDYFISIGRTAEAKDISKGRFEKKEEPKPKKEKSKKSE